MFYHFSQNNSGGSFHFDENKGITSVKEVTPKEVTKVEYI